LAEAQPEAGIAQVISIAAFRTEPVRNQSSDIFRKLLYPTSVKRIPSYSAPTSSSVMGRATYAASKMLVTRDYTGRRKINTSYFLSVLSSAFVHTAYRPYWNRSVAAPFSDFGSTVGNDAGMNLWHEFKPGIEQLMKSHTPRFVTRIEESLERR
jgi:hypothetical protein